MRKKIFFVITTVVLLSCNLPVFSNQTSSNKTPTPDVVATRVAEMLATQSIQPTAKGFAQPTSTTQPSAIPTVKSTSTPLPTSTQPANQASTPTLSAQDILSALGNPVWKDTLENGKSWGIDEQAYEDENTRIAVENGKMLLTSIQPRGWLGWRLASPQPQNFYLEATFHTLDCTGSDSYGLVFRARDYSSSEGYYFGVRCDGQFNFTARSTDGGNTLVKSTSSSAIIAGGNATNRVGVLAQGNKLTLYVNGSPIQEVTDSTYQDGGHIGVFISGEKTPNFSVEMDEISYWNAPQ